MSNIALTSTTLSGFLETDFQQFKDVIQDGGVNAIVLDVNQTGTSGVGATLRRDLASGSTDNSVVKITQDNAGDDQPALSIQQDGNADALQINTTATMDGEYGIRIDATSASTTVDAAGGIRIAGGSARGIYCVRDSTSAYTTGAVAAIIQTNAGDDQPALEVQQDGSAQAILCNGFLGLGAPTELTIATGIVTATRSYHTIDTEADAASDDLDTINGGNNGDILICKSAASGRVVTFKDGTGNLLLAGDFVADNARDTITLLWGTGLGWMEISRSNNL